MNNISVKINRQRHNTIPMKHGQALHPTEQKNLQSGLFLSDHQEPEAEPKERFLHE